MRSSILPSFFYPGVPEIRFQVPEYWVETVTQGDGMVYVFWSDPTYRLTQALPGLGFTIAETSLPYDPKNKLMGFYQFSETRTSLKKANFSGDELHIMQKSFFFALPHDAIGIFALTTISPLIDPLAGLLTEEIFNSVEFTKPMGTEKRGKNPFKLLPRFRKPFNND